MVMLSDLYLVISAVILPLAVHCPSRLSWPSFQAGIWLSQLLSYHLLYIVTVVCHGQVIRLVFGYQFLSYLLMYTVPVVCHNQVNRMVFGYLRAVILPLDEHCPSTLS